MYKQFILIFLMAIALCSCESRSVSEGRVAYKEYFKKTLKDPNSLVIYSEEVVSKDEYSATFVVDMGAKNSYGGMVRSTYTFETTGPHMINVKEYDIRTLPKQDTTPKEELKFEEPKFNFTYRNKMTPVAGFVAEDYLTKEFVLSDSCIYVDSRYDLPECINAAKKKDGKKIEYLGGILPSGTKVKIISFTEDAFEVKYDGSKTCYIEQSAIF